MSTPIVIIIIIIVIIIYLRIIGRDLPQRNKELLWYASPVYVVVLRLHVFSMCTWPVRVTSFRNLTICFEELFEKENRTFHFQITSIRLSVRLLLGVRYQTVWRIFVELNIGWGFFIYKNLRKAEEAWVSWKCARGSTLIFTLTLHTHWWFHLIST
jgi:hypothetical protein